MPAMNRKFQRSARRFAMSVHRPVAFDLAVLALLGRLGRAEGLVELLQQVGQLEVRRRLERVVVAHQRQRHAERPTGTGRGRRR